MHIFKLFELLFYQMLKFASLFNDYTCVIFIIPVFKSAALSFNYIFIVIEASLNSMCCPSAPFCACWHNFSGSRPSWRRLNKSHSPSHEAVTNSCHSARIDRSSEFFLHNIPFIVLDAAAAAALTQREAQEHPRSMAHQTEQRRAIFCLISTALCLWCSGPCETKSSSQIPHGTDKKSTPHT